MTRRTVWQVGGEGEAAPHSHAIYVEDSEVGEANGVAPLNASSKIDSTYLPSLSLFEEQEVADQAARLALPLDADSPMLVVQADNGTLWYIPANTDPSVSGNWTQLGTSPVSSVGDGTTQLTGAVDLTSLFVHTDLSNVPSDLVLWDDANTTFPSLNGSRVASIEAVTTIVGNAYVVDFGGPAVKHITLDDDILNLSAINAPAAGTLGLVEVWFHQATSPAGPFDVDMTELAALADDWGIDGPPTAMPQGSETALVVQLRHDEGTTRGSWSAPNVWHVALLGSDPAASSDASTGNGKTFFVVPAAMNGASLTAVRGDLADDGTTASTIMLRRNRAGTDADMLSTAITIDANEVSSSTAATAAVIDTANDDLATGDRVFFDLDGVGTGSRGHLATLTITGPPA